MSKARDLADIATLNYDPATDTLTVGTINSSSGMALDNNQAITIDDAGGTAINALTMNTSNVFVFGADTGPDAFQFRSENGSHRFYVGGSQLLSVQSDRVEPGAHLQFGVANPQIRGNDDNGLIYLYASNTISNGGLLKLYGKTHSGQAGDIEFEVDGADVLHYDNSTTTWDFIGSDLDFGSGAIFDWNSGDVTLTHSAGALTVAGGNVLMGDAAGAALMDEAASSTNPTLIPNRADLDTGIGWVSADRLNLVAGGTDLMNLRSSDIQFGASQFRGSNSAGPALMNEAAAFNNPTLIPNLADDDTGIGWDSSGSMAFISNAGRTAIINHQGVLCDNASAGAIKDEATSATNPTLIPNRGELNTGIGLESSAVLSFIGTDTQLANVSATEMAVSSNVRSTRYYISSVDAAVTAAGTVLANSTLLTDEVNLVTTGTPNQGVRLPNGVAGLRITVLNTTGNTINLYPFVNGQINALGSNIALGLADGSKLDFVSTSATQWYTLNATYA